MVLVSGLCILIDSVLARKSAGMAQPWEHLKMLFIIIHSTALPTRPIPAQKSSCQESGKLAGLLE